MSNDNSTVDFSNVAKGGGLDGGHYSKLSPNESAAETLGSGKVSPEPTPSDYATPGVGGGPTYVSVGGPTNSGQ
jgi:hypothetical protein